MHFGWRRSCSRDPTHYLTYSQEAMPVKKKPRKGSFWTSGGRCLDWSDVPSPLFNKNHVPEDEDPTVPKNPPTVLCQYADFLAKGEKLAGDDPELFFIHHKLRHTWDRPWKMYILNCFDGYHVEQPAGMLNPIKEYLPSAGARWKKKHKALAVLCMRKLKGPNWRHHVGKEFIVEICDTSDSD